MLIERLVLITTLAPRLRNFAMIGNKRETLLEVTKGLSMITRSLALTKSRSNGL